MNVAKIQLDVSFKQLIRERIGNESGTRNESGTNRQHGTNQEHAESPPPVENDPSVGITYATPYVGIMPLRGNYAPPWELGVDESFYLV